VHTICTSTCSADINTSPQRRRTSSSKKQRRPSWQKEYTSASSKTIPHTKESLNQEVNCKQPLTRPLSGPCRTNYGQHTKQHMRQQENNNKTNFTGYNNTSTTPTQHQQKQNNHPHKPPTKRCLPFMRRSYARGNCAHKGEMVIQPHGHSTQ
jgi:hypothetical protein